MKRQPVFQKRPPLHYVGARPYRDDQRERSLFLAKREGRTSANTLINGLGHAIPRDPFEKLRTIDLARFRNEGCILTASLSPCTECSNDAGAVSVCPLTPRWRERKGDRRVPRERMVRRGRRLLIAATKLSSAVQFASHSRRRCSAILMLSQNREVTLIVYCWNERMLKYSRII